MPELAAPGQEQQTAGIAEMLARNKSGAAAPQDSASSYMHPARSDPGSVSSYKTSKRATPNLLSHRDSSSTADPGANTAPISPGASAAIAIGVALFVIVLAALGLRNTGRSWKGRNGGRRTDEEATDARENGTNTGGSGNSKDDDVVRRPQPAPRAADTAIRKQLQLQPHVEQRPLARGLEPSSGRRPQLAPTTRPSPAPKEKDPHAAVVGDAAGRGDGPELRHPKPISPSSGACGGVSALLGDGGGGGGVILPPVLTPGWCPTPSPRVGVGVDAAASSYFTAQPASCRGPGVAGVARGCGGGGHISRDIAPFQGQEEDVVGSEQRRERERRERLAELMRRQGEVGVRAGRQGQ